MELRKPKRACRVAVLFNFDLEMHRSYTDIIRRIISRDYQFRVTFISVELTQEAVRKKVLESVYSPNPYDVFVPIGLRCGVFLKQVYDELGRGKAIFLGSLDPVGQGLINSFESPGPDVTAVAFERPSNIAVAEKFLPVAKYIKRIILPFVALNARDIMNQRVRDVADFFRAHELLVEVVALAPQGWQEVKKELEEFLKNRLSKHDVVLVLEGGFPGFYKETACLCFERDAVFCADTLSSMYRGAALAFAGQLDAAAVALHEMLISHWIDGVPLGSIPVKVVPDDRAFVVNIAMLRMANFPEEAIQLLKEEESNMVIKKWVGSPLEQDDW